jgi:exopolysaccharide production protein ExoZ
MLYTSMGRFGSWKAAPDFLLRRLIRIVPLYWICTLAVIALALSGLFYKSLIVTGPGVAASLLFLPTEPPILGVAWTLQYEMYFYLVFAACLAFLTIRSTIVVLPLVLCGVLALSTALPDGRVRAFFGDPIALEFCLGLWLAYAFAQGRLPKIHPALAAALGVAGLMASALIFPSAGTERLASSVRYFAWGLPALLIVFAALSVRSMPGLGGRALLFLGNASYSIYLTHAIVMTSYARLIKTPAIAALLPPVLWMILAVAAATVVGALTHVLVEQPLHEGLKRRWTAGSRKPSSLASRPASAG